MSQQLLPGLGTGGHPAVQDQWSARGFISFGLICVAVLAGGLGTWAATASLAGAVIASGEVRVETNRQVVQHPDGGVVGEILARDGDTVEAGDILIKLDDTLLRSELAALESQLFEIIARRGRLRAVQAGANEIRFAQELMDAAQANPEVAELIEGQRSLFEARRVSVAKETAILEERKLQLEDQIVGAQAELEAIGKQARLIGKELFDMRSLLDRGHVPASRVLALEREEARLLGQSGQMTAQIARLRGQIAEIRIEQNRMTTSQVEEAVAEERELGFRELELRERRLSLREKLSRLEIRTPRPGVVIDSTVHALKSVVRAAEPILYVIPTDTDLVIDARVDPNNIDQMYRGQEAVVRFSAFNARTTPEIFGEVVSVSPDVITDEVRRMTYYRAEVALKDGELEKLGDQELVAGMPVEVYIQTAERTPIQYLVKPITDYFNRAWRED